MFVKALVVAGAFAAGGLVVQQTWQQESWPGVPFQLGSAVAVVPSANDVWCWSASESTPVPVAPVSIAGVNPTNGNRWATITDIAIMDGGSYSPVWWWIRDGNTGQILYGEPFASDHNNYSRVARVHLSTPIVLSYSGSNPPTLEVGDRLGVPVSGATSWFYGISVIGRYVYNT